MEIMLAYVNHNKFFKKLQLIFFFFFVFLPYICQVISNDIKTKIRAFMFATPTIVSFSHSLKYIYINKTGKDIQYN